ncbi:putative monovalent cation/H+ antiporter subunit D [Rickettsia akari str. Hartford]|uniref:Monovalent cation/H+ antiporter subunit D n=1 Tax=Rickettsia akari (strain Hartford) TaxID=293614 RepID=A8GMU0_RICAH|nr:putative monovalent cation/H+ antiporter subunit D [Rickettsia akari str. Hartford]
MAYGLVKFNAQTSKVDRIKRLGVVNCVIMFFLVT